MESVRKVEAVKAIWWKVDPNHRRNFHMEEEGRSQRSHMLDLVVIEHSLLYQKHNTHMKVENQNMIQTRDLLEQVEAAVMRRLTLYLDEVLMVEFFCKRNRFFCS